MASPRRVKVQIVYGGAVSSSSSAVVQKTSNQTNESDNIKYTVVRGDTLWAIAKRFLGEGSRYTVIYNANKDLIEATAKAHGKPNSDNGHWIWAGEVLTIPVTEDQEKAIVYANSKTAKQKLGNKIENALSSFSYTDEASGKSDSISITMHDIGKEWIGDQMPQKGVNIGAKIVFLDWEDINEFVCGNFTLDDISFSGYPTTCNLSGVSVPAMDDFKSKPQTQTFEKTTIRQIASQFATKAKVSLVYDASDVQIAEVEQKNKTNSAFLYELCEKYGLAMKVYNHKIVIFDFLTYEAKKSVLTLSNKNIEKWSYNTTIDGTYTGIEFSYTNPNKKKNEPSTIKVNLGTSGRTYYINAQASSRYDAELQAAAKINKANREIETMSITCLPCNLVASQCVKVTGLGKIDGKYFIDKIKHDVSGKGYSMQLTLHKVQTPIKA